MSDLSKFRLSDNIEDRRKEHFLSFPQAPQGPNVFADNSGLMNLNAQTDFAPVPAENAISTAAGAKILDAQEQKYLADRAGRGTAANDYNTPLTPLAQEQFQAWGANQPKDPQREMQDYDLQGWWQANQGKNLGEGQLTDQWKKPNHPTFSTESQYHGVDGNEGGTWIPTGNEKYTFQPGRTNFDNHKIEDMKQYFQDREPGNTLDVSTYPTEPGYMPKWMGQ